MISFYSTDFNCDIFVTKNVFFCTKLMFKLMRLVISTEKVHLTNLSHFFLKGGKDLISLIIEFNLNQIFLL